MKVEHDSDDPRKNVDFFVYSVSLKNPFKLHLTSDKGHMVISLSVEYGLHIPDHIFYRGS